jgi:hypothetical protein
MTSLYFEAEDEDDLRRIGFSKDGKFESPQIMLGLLVGRGRLSDRIRHLRRQHVRGQDADPRTGTYRWQYDVGTPVVVADAAMLSHKNLTALDRLGYPFIVAARIRNEAQTMQETILARCEGLQNGQCIEIEHEYGRLIVAYTDARARKDGYNRERGLRRLRKRIGNGRLSKEHLNNRGYNRFLKLTGEVTVELDEAKVAQAARWDGLKGYLTNTKLSPEG